MTSMQRIQEFLGLKRFAFVGVSHEPGDFSRSLFRDLLKRGYQAVPVHPDAGQVDGQPCFAHVGDIVPPVEAALLMTAPAVTDQVIEECAAAGITRVWLYRGAGQGAVTAGAVRFCEAHGISVIPGECPFMFLPGEPWFHRFHGFVRKIAGSYPR